MNVDEKELLEQVLLNQAVIYEMLRKLVEPGKLLTPKGWILEELNKKAEEFKKK